MKYFFGTLSMALVLSSMAQAYPGECKNTLMLAAMDAAQGEITKLTPNQPDKLASDKQVQDAEDYIDIVGVAAEQFCRKIAK